MDHLKHKLKTYGCKVNSYDSGLIQQQLQSSALKNEDTTGLFILNTCAVTAEATKEALREIRKIKRDNKDSVVVVTGCAAQVDTEKFTAEDSVDLVVANSHKSQLAELISEKLKQRGGQKLYKSNIFKKEDMGKGGGLESSHTRSFLKIQDGCNSFCTYCVIPFARGKSQSISIDENIARINEIYESGARELVITGIHIGDYSDDSLERQRGLEDLIEQVLKKTKMPRIRLSSLEPPEVSDRLLDLYSDKKMCPHFHMSIQSAQSRILKEMKRAYGHKEVEDSLNKISKKVKNVYVGMDVIAGFPGEADAEHIETMERLKVLPWTRIHVFPYSPRPGVYANRLEGQLERSLIMKRSQQLRELSFKRLSEKAQEQKGSIKKVLVLNGGLHGLSRDYWNIKLSRPATVGTEINVKVLPHFPQHESSSAANVQLLGREV